MEGYQIQDFDESPSVRQLRQFVTSRLSAGPVRDFAGFERDVHKAVVELEKEVLRRGLQSLDVRQKRVSVAGIEYRRVLEDQPETYMSAAGPIAVKRCLFVQVGKAGRAVCPLELQAGIVGGFWTPLAARQATFAVAHMTPIEVEKLFAELGNMTPSRSSLDRLPKVLSDKWEANRVEWDERVRILDAIHKDAVTVAYSLDGVMISMKDADEGRSKPRRRKRKREVVSADSRRDGEDKTTGSAETTEEDATPLPALGEAARVREEESKPEDGDTSAPAAAQPPSSAQDSTRGFREAACATVSFYNCDGERLHTIRYARMPEFKKATLAQQLKAEYESVLDTCPNLRIAKISDGADENWRILDELVPASPPGEGGPVDILDFFHASEKLKEALDAYHGKGTVTSAAEHARLCVILKTKEGGVNDVIRALRHMYSRVRAKAKKKILKERLAYFRSQRHRMNYYQYLKDNLPIGSGVVEAANKTLVTQRCKRSGQSWKIRGGQGILTCRSLLQSDRWEDGWALLAASFRTAVQPVESSHKRRTARSAAA